MAQKKQRWRCRRPTTSKPLSNMKKTLLILAATLLPVIVFASQISVPSSSTYGNVLISNGLGPWVASTTDPLNVGSLFATSTATSTFGGGIKTNLLNVISNTASSTFNNGVNLNGGCFAVNNVCVGTNFGTVTGVTASWPILSSGGTAPNITWAGFASSSPISAGLLYATGVNTFASVSTSSPVNMSITGNAGTVTTNANLTGVVTSIGNATLFGTTAVGNSILANNTSGTAIPAFLATSSLGVALSDTTGVLATNRGGTNLNSYTTGDTLYASNTNVLSRLAIGTAGFVLASLNGIPTWVASTTISNLSAMKQAVNYATTGALAANTYALGVLTEVGTGALSVDSASPTVGQRILVKNEVTQTNNGIYTVTATGSGIAAYVLTRATDYNTSDEIYPGVASYVLSGTVNGTDTWVLTSPAPVVLDTTNLTYAESATGNITLPISVANGGTNKSSYPINSFITSDSAGTSLIATTSDITISSVLATSTTATSTFSFGVKATRFNATTGTSTFAGLVSQTGGLTITTLPSCSGGSSALTTDGSGNIVCGAISAGTGTVTSITAGDGLLGGTITSSGTFYGQVGTSSIPTINPAGVAYWTTQGTATAPAKLGTTATTTLGGSGPITVTAGGSVIGASPISVGCATCLTANQTITLSGAVSGSGSTAITTAFGVSAITPLGVLNGGTGGTGFTSNQLIFYNGSALVSASTTFVGGTGNAIGLGTTSPSWQLDIASSTGAQLALSDTSILSSRHTFRSVGGNFYISSSTALTGATSTLMSFVASPNLKGNLVGIASDTPWGIFSINPTAVASSTGLLPQTNQVVPEFVVGSTTATHFIIDGGGNVGIGTTTPGSLLSIQGSANFTTATSTILGNGLSLSRLFTTASSTFAGLVSGNGVSLSTLKGCSTELITDLTGGITCGGVTINAGTVTSITVTVPAFLAVSPTSAITTSGTFAISLSGTPLPYANGGTNGSGFVANQLVFANATSLVSASTTFVGGNGGAIGLGTTSPQWQLQIASSTGPQLVLSDTTITDNHWAFRGIGNSFYFGTSSPTIFAAGTSTPGILSILSNGYVGFASSTPWSRFSIGNAGGIGTVSASSSITVASYEFGATGNEATSTAKTIDVRTSNTIVWPIGTAATTITLCGFVPGTHVMIQVLNPNASAGALTWALCAGEQLYWPGGTKPTQTTTANHWDMWSFVATGSYAVATTTPGAVIVSGSAVAF